MSAACGVPVHAGGPEDPTATTRCCCGVRNTVEPASAVVTVTVLVPAAGVISPSGGGLTAAKATSLQPGAATGGAVCVGRGVAGRLVCQRSGKTGQ